MTSWPMRGICDRAPALARPVGCDTRTQHELFSSLLPVAVPVELHLHAAVLVGPDLLARRRRRRWRFAGPATTGRGVLRAGRNGV